MREPTAGELFQALNPKMEQRPFPLRAIYMQVKKWQKVPQVGTNFDSASWP
jgi:hypothetical protein